MTYLRGGVERSLVDKITSAIFYALTSSESNILINYCFSLSKLASIEN